MTDHRTWEGRAETATLVNVAAHALRTTERRTWDNGDAMTEAQYGIALRVAARAVAELVRRGVITLEG